MGKHTARRNTYLEPSRPQAAESANRRALSMSHAADRRLWQGFHPWDRWRRVCHSHLRLVSKLRSWALEEEPTQARLVILIRIRKMEIPMKLPVIELHSNGMVRFLINSPHSAGEVQTCPD